MKSQSILFFAFFFFSLITVQPTIAADGHLYEETINSITRVDGEYFRWTETREFLIIDYHPITTDDTRQMEIRLQDSTQNGRIETITQPLKIANFELTPVLNPDESPLAYLWDIFLFRDVDNPSLTTSPLDDVIRSAFSKSEQRVFDLDSTNLFFSVNLQHFEKDNTTDSKRIMVNTELSTKNFKDGRIEKSAVHLKKVDDDGNTIFEYSFEIQEKSTVQRYLNYLDQPSLYVPLQIASVLLLVYIYVRAHKYWNNNEIMIIKAKGKKVTIELIDNPDDESDISDSSETTSD